MMRHPDEEEARMSEATHTVAIVGASPKPDRYSHQAVLKYRAAGWTVWPVNPSRQAVDGLAAYASLAELPGKPDIVCMYVNPKAGAEMLDQIVAAAPKQLWLNPGADGEPIASAARAKGLHVVEACTLVALGYGNPLEVAARFEGRKG
jgi:predicted CoA-binding protein